MGERLSDEVFNMPQPAFEFVAGKYWPDPHVLLPLAEQAGAAVTVHQPMQAEGRGTSNNIRLPKIVCFQALWLRNGLNRIEQIPQRRHKELEQAGLNSPHLSAAF